MNAVGLEIGGTKIQAIACDKAGNQLAQARAAVIPRDGAEAIQRSILQVTKAVLDEIPEISAIGVGFGGPVDSNRGRVIRSFQIEGWDGFPITEWLESAMDGIPVFLENDSNAAAYAEAALGAGRGHSHVLYSNNGSGIGGGFVIQGELYRGAGCTELEIGHLRMNSTGEILEDRCSGWILNKKIRSIAEETPDSELAKLAASFPEAEARALEPALNSGNAGARTLMEEATRDYALALSHAVNLLSPSIIVLGGGVAFLGEHWRGAVARHLPAFIIDPLKPGPEIELASLGEAVVPLGAALLALKRLR